MLCEVDEIEFALVTVSFLSRSRSEAVVMFVQSISLAKGSVRLARRAAGFPLPTTILAAIFLLHRESRPCGESRLSMTPTKDTKNQQIGNYIGRQWRGSSATEYIDLINLATNEVLAQVPASQREDVAAAISAAETLPSGDALREDRVQYLFKLKQILKDHI
jgi:hypothetical protein